jgi:hypothetical protein
MSAFEGSYLVKTRATSAPDSRLRVTWYDDQEFAMTYPSSRRTDVHASCGSPPGGKADHTIVPSSRHLVIWAAYSSPSSVGRRINLSSVPGISMTSFHGPILLERGFDQRSPRVAPPLVRS